jgi:hypothetical protein
LTHSQYSGRKETDRNKLKNILDNPKDYPLVVIDDFHRLDDSLKMKIGDLVKVYAEQDKDNIACKIIIIGINKCGSSLIQITPDLAKRLAIHKVRSANKEQTFELIKKGEDKLNIDFPEEGKELIFEEAEGDYWLTQLICKKICLTNKVFSESHERKKILINIPETRSNIVTELAEKYQKEVIEFIRGRRFRQSNRPYFKLLRSISETGQSTVNLDQLASQDPKIKPSIDNIKISRLRQLITDKENLQKYFFYDPTIITFSIEDPAVAYYIRHLDWEGIRKDAGFTKETEEKEYEVAFSFAGSTRELVEYVNERLKNQEVTTFYDSNYESRLLGANLEDEFSKIYSSESKFVVVFIDNDFKERLWPRFELSCYKPRVAKKEVIPIKLNNTIIQEIPETIGRIDFTWNKNEDWKAKVELAIINKILEKIK